MALQNNTISLAFRGLSNFLSFPALKKSSQSYDGDVAAFFEVDDAIILKLPGDLGVSESNSRFQQNLISVS